MSRPSIGWVRKRVHGGIGMTGTRSTSRTRKRNERDRAPMTIDARSATEPGTASSSSSSTFSRDGHVRRDRAGGQDAAEVDDAPRRPTARRPRRTAARPPPRARRTTPFAARSMEWMR